MTAAPRASLGQERGPLWMRAVAALMACLPWRALGAIGAAIGWLAGSLIRVRRRQVEDALTESGIADPSRVARRMYASLGTGLAEILWLAGRSERAIEGRFTMDPEAARALRDAGAGGRGVIVATAHTGNWDLVACAAARWLREDAAAPEGKRGLTVVTKRLSWRALDRYWQHLRRERGVTLVEAAGAAARVRAALSEGSVVALLVDQAPERRSGVITLPFLGRDARHDLAPALLAARARVPIVVLCGHRDERGGHVLALAGVIEASELRGRGAIEAATARIAQAVERAVRARPEQWLWLHRRWKQ